MKIDKELGDFIYELIKIMKGNKTLPSSLLNSLESHLRAFDPDKDQKTAKGVVAVAINPNGAVVAKGSCFENFAPGGMRVDESQRRRAVDSMKMEFAKDHLNHFMTDKLDIYFASDFWEQATKNGYRAEIINVGYPKNEFD